MRKFSAKCSSCKKRKIHAKKQYPSASITYSACMDEYNQLLSNYDKIYDRVNIALVLCGTVFMIFSTNLDFSMITKWSEYSCFQKVAGVLCAVLLIASSVLMAISIIDLLVLSCSKGLKTFDSNSIKTEALYEEKSENTLLWITLQYLRVINDMRQKINDKQKRYNRAIVLIILAVILYVLSLFIGKAML